MASVQDLARSVVDILKRKLEVARDQLIDRNLRNRLVNCTLTSKRSKQVRIVDESPDEVFRILIAQKKEMSFGAGRGVESEDEGGEQEDFDIGVWTPPDDGELEVDGVAKRHRDNILQTQLTKEGLQKRLTGLYYESREVEEEQGVNVLYLALGFLKWFEDTRSEVERFAPLVLLPVELTRNGARDRFRLKIRDDDLFTNVSLKVWLSEQHSIQLPDLQETDDWTPTDYFEQVRIAIQAAERWAVLDSDILLGFFSFSKFLLWKDLDTANWPENAGLLEHTVLKKLLAPQEENGIPDPPVIADDERIDDVFKAADLVYPLDADSSQTTAIQTALAGRDFVVQGPPGTGKSQTIANMICAAVANGKSVLFVAEKLAALQVVYERLRNVGLGPLCLELHSRKASKQQVVAQLREAIESQSPPTVAADLCSRLDASAQRLWAHSDRHHRIHEPCGYTPFQVAGRMCLLEEQGVDIPTFKVHGGEIKKRQEIQELLQELDALAKRLVVSGIPSRHPWRHCGRQPINPLDSQRLTAIATKAAGSVQALGVVLKSVWPLVRPSEGAELTRFSFDGIRSIAGVLSLVAEKPDEDVEILCAPRWSKDLPLLEELARISQRLKAVSDELTPIVVPDAWDRDWSVDRAEIAGSGRSFLRVFRSAYRGSMRTLRGVCRSKLPSHLDQRIRVLDLLQEGRSLREGVANLSVRLSPEISQLVESLPSAADRVVAIASWLRKATSFEPLLSPRNRKLLEWTDTPDKWANQLLSIEQRVREAVTELCQFVSLNDPFFPKEGGQLSTPFGELVSRTQAWAESADRFNEWPPVRLGLGKLAALTNGDFCLRVFDGRVQPDKLAGQVELAVMEQMWNAMCAADQDLALADGRLLDREVATFRTLDSDRGKAAAHEVARRHYDRKPTGTLGDMGVIRAELNKSRKLLPVRKLVAKAGYAVQQLKPIFLMSPLSIAQYLAPGRMEFDLLLIDEASQVRPADALGAIARAKQVVVVGDAKQLPPTNFFNRLLDESDEVEDADEEGIPSVALGAMESILSLCDASLNTRTMLSWHYRSHHPALIAVSNRNFYDNRLLLPPSVLRERAGDGFGVVFNRTPSGAYDRGKSATNTVEADIVADAVISFAKNTPNKTLGVGTFSVAQRDAIRDSVDAKRRSDPSVEPFFATGRPEPFMVKNLESIQGDERDVIFISVGYGRGADGRLVSSFGPINNDGGERRLNVLISRARERCEVFSSISADDIDIGNRKRGVVALKEFLQFAEKGYFDIPTPTTKSFDSDFEESVATFLRSNGFKVDPQVGMAGFFIDLGVREPTDEARYRLGVECDGATYHSSRSARDRDRIRQSILESRGWTIHRIWSTDWFHRREAEQERLLRVLASKQSTSESPVVRPVPKGPSAQSTVSPPLTLKVAHAAPVIGRPYVQVSFEVHAEDEIHEAPSILVHETVRRIVEAEGPIHEDEVARRLATVWGLDRCGSRIQATTLTALGSLMRQAVLVKDGQFWSLTGRVILFVRSRANVESATLRRAEYLPPSEIVHAARELLKTNVRVPIENMVVEIARLLGFQRCGGDLQEVIGNALSSQLHNHIETSPTGQFLVHLPENGPAEE